MSYTFNNEKPIYLQVVEIITNEIIKGNIAPGEKIPSVREYSLIMKVNPNTICKSLDILENNKLIITERTNGKFVTKDENILNKYKKDLITEKINNFLSDMEKLGFSKEDIINSIKE